MDLSVRQEKDYSVLSVSGKLDWEGAELLDKELDRLIAEGCRGIVLVLDSVSFICSGGIGAMVANLNKLKRMGGELYVVSSSDYVNTMFQDLRFGLVLSGRIYDSYERFSSQVLGKTRKSAK